MSAMSAPQTRSDLDLAQLRRTTGAIAAAIELGHRGQAGRRPDRPDRAAGRGPPADRGRARASARRCWPRRWPAPSTASVRRIQFTPDLLPSDVTGVSVYNQETRDFEFKPGAIFANVVVGDEINRASPKTQSALLECMEERQVTVDGITYHAGGAVHGRRHPEPDRDGGHLPAARGPARPLHGPGLDGLPRRRAELAMLEQPRLVVPAGRPAAGRRPPPTCASSWRRPARCYVSDAVKQYAVDIWPTATRVHPDLRLGASPRATLHLLRAARAPAALDGRDHVLPDDVQALAVPVLAHRLLLTADAQLARRTAQDVVADLVQRVPVPAGPVS